MTNSYKTSFNRLRLHKGFGKMLEALERGFERFGIDYYLVGAVSRNAWLSGIGGLTPKRATADIDFAVFINDKSVYETMKEYFITEEKFSPYRENAFVLIWEDGTQVDLLPFGAIEDQDRRVTVEGTGYTSVHVDGFKEVYDQPLPEIELDTVHRFKFATLPGIVLLKLAAWDDRPEARADDIKDISEILDHFFELNEELIFGNYLDLFEQEPAYNDGRSGLLLIAANVLGKEVGKICFSNEKLFARVKSIIGRNAFDARTSPMGKIIAAHFNITVEEACLLIKEIEKGLMLE